MTDESYIKLAIEIAKKGSGNVSPNPLVGCVIIKNDRIIGAGYHEKFGKSHAEINAITNAKEKVEGSTLYVNLEPCSHTGKTPPCVDEIIETKIKRVVIGTLDMNPLVSGNGVKKLKSAGIDVKVGVLEKDCIELNKFFFKHITKKIPYITLKAAQTIDGKIADLTGDSKWISSLSSRKYVHELRSKYDAVLVGTNTVIRDNPSLTVRLSEGRNPKRVIIDSGLKLKTDKKIFLNNKDKNLILVTSKININRKRKLKKLFALDVDIIFAKEEAEGSIDLMNVFKELGKRGINSVLVEGGSTIFTSLIKKKLFDDILLFISPKILGNGLSIVGDLKIKSIGKAVKVKVEKLETCGDDIFVELKK